MSDESLHPVDVLAEEYLDRLRNGESISIEEYELAHPQLADEIRNLFPALEMLERGKPRSDELHLGPSGAAVGLKSTILGDYRIIREVGRGGMGIVYEAEQFSLNRRVAVKVLAANVGQNARALLRFRREARCAAQLHHTNIVPVFEIGHDDGQHYYAMQFIQGRSLQEVIGELVALRSRSVGTCVSNRIQRELRDAHGKLNNSSLPDPMVTIDSSRNMVPLPSGRSTRTDFTVGWSQVLYGDRKSLTEDRMPTPVDEAQQSDRPSADAPPMTAHGDPREEPLDDVHSRGPPDSSGDPFQVSRDLADQPSAAYYDAVAAIGAQLADALAYAHDQGVLHRDVKPANILMDVYGIAWLTDFGLARMEASGLTQTGEVMGTLHYMPPERFQGITDRRGDVYSLGLTLYELLTLAPELIHRKFAATTIRGDASHSLPPPRTIDPMIPKDLETIVLKAISGDPSNRYESAAKFAQDLRCFQARLPIEARRAQWLTKIWLWCRRNRSLAGMTSAAALLLLVACLGWATSYAMRHQRDRATQAEAAAHQARVEAEQAEELAQASHYLARATSARISGIPGSRQRAIDALRQAVARNRHGTLTQEIRDEATATLAMVDVRAQTIPWQSILPRAAADDVEADDMRRQTLQRLTQRADQGLRIIHAFSRDYKSCAILDEESRHVWVTDVQNRQVLAVLPLRDLPHFDKVNSTDLSLGFSPKGRFLIVGESLLGGVLAVIDIGTGQPRLVETACYASDISPEDRWLAVTRSGTSVELMDLHQLEQVRRIDTPWRPVRLKFNGDATQLAVGYGSGLPSIGILDCATATVVAELDVGRPGAEDLAWLGRGGNILIARGVARRSEIWSVPEQRRILETAASQDFAAGCAADPLERFFVSNHWNGVSVLWDAHSAQLYLTFPRLDSYNWSADGTILGSRQSINGIEFYYVEAGSAYQALRDWMRDGNDYDPQRGQFSPDGRLIVAYFRRADSQWETLLKVWDATTHVVSAGMIVDQLTAMSTSSDGSALWLLGRQGYYRLPLSFSAANRLSIGPAELLRGTDITLPEPAGISASGLQFAFIRHGELQIHSLASSQPYGLTLSKDGLSDDTVEPQMANNAVVRRMVPPQQTHAIVSPDGRWIVTLGWHSPSVSLWQVPQGKLVHEWQVGPQNLAHFTPDSRQLILCRWDAYRFWDLETLTNTANIPRFDTSHPDPIAISPNGNFAVASLRPGELDLVRLPQGNTLLRLRRPGQSRPFFLAFGPDGTKILEGTATSPGVSQRSIGIWDLTRLNDELSALDLDLNDLELPDRIAEMSPISAARFVECDILRRSDFLGEMSLEDAKALLAEWEEAYAKNPQDPSLANNLAWGLLVAPEPLRDFPRALALAEQAYSASPNSVTRNTLAVAHYRSHHFDRAIELLEVNILDSSKAELPWDLLFLAMSLAATGEMDQAKYHLRLAEHWMTAEDNGRALVPRSSQAELDSLHAEAKALLDF